MAEMVACPSCQRKLQVPEQYLGQKVQCPECRHLFVASLTNVTAQPMPASEAKPTAKPRHYEDDEFDPPIRRRGYRDRDDFDDVEDDDYVGFRIRRRGEFPPHRGGLILALGLVAIVGGLLMLFPFAIGPIAWLLGSLDLRAMNDGRMDPEGRSMTQAGQVLGLVSTVFLVLGVLGIGCCFFARIP